MSNANRWKKVGIIALSSGMSQMIIFAFGLLLVRILSISDYAVYRQGMLIVNTISPFFAIMSPISLSYFIAKAKSEQEKTYYVKQTVYSLVTISFIGAVLVAVFGNEISAFYNNPALNQYVISFAIILFAESSTQYFAYYMACIDKEKVLMRYTLSFSVLKTLSLVAAVLYGKNHLAIFLCLYTFVVFAKFLFVFYYTFRFHQSGLLFKPQKSLIRQQLVFSIPVYIVGIINSLNMNLDKIVVSGLFLPEQYAIYENGAYQIPFIGILSSSIIAVMLPNITKQFDKDNRPSLNQLIAHYKGVIKVSFGILFALFIALLACAEGVVVLLFSEKYYAAVPIFKIYLGMVLLQSLNLGVLLTSANQQKEIVKAGLVMVACNLSILLLLANLNQFTLLSVAPVLSLAVMNLLMLFSIKKVYAQPSIWSVIPLSYIGKLIIPGIVCCFLFMYIQGLVPINLIVKTIIFGPLCFGVQLAVNYLILRQERNKIE